MATKLALTDCAALIVTVQLPVPLQAPPQADRLEPRPGVAVSVTIVPEAKFALQLLPEQLIPAGLLVTVPLPVALTDSAKLGVANVALTDCALFIVTEQPPVPLHAPPQPESDWPDPGTAVAVSVTMVPTAKFALQVLAIQLIPAGLLVTVPLPVTVTVSA